MSQRPNLLTRGVAEIPTQKDLESQLETGKKLRIKFGIDPTGVDLTLGHAVVFRKLAEFQRAGHQIILLFGTFTAKIGDPTGKDKTRKILSDADISQNMATYLSQAGKFLDLAQCEIVKNGDWLEKLNFSEILEIAGNFTVAQMLERDMFQKRISENREINLVEFFYPLMQGYDSVAIAADLELGGNDQLFNMMAARPIQKHFSQKPQSVLTLEILPGTDGTEKMSKSLGNYIAVFDSPREIFGKTMSIPDDLMSKWFWLLTDFSENEIANILAGHPRDAKLRLAFELVKMLHDENLAHTAQAEFLEMFQKKGLPDEMPTITFPETEKSLLEIIISANFDLSNTEIRRLISAGSVKIDGEKITEKEKMIPLTKEQILQVGKRKFAKIISS